MFALTTLEHDLATAFEKVRHEGRAAMRVTNYRRNELGDLAFESCDILSESEARDTWSGLLALGFVRANSLIVAR